MKKLTWPVAPVLTDDTVQWGLEVAYDEEHQLLLDCFSDVGAVPLLQQTLEAWIRDGMREGHAIRKPQVYYDEMRDCNLPHRIGHRLGIVDPRVFYSSSGAAAVEAAIKLARKATGRMQVYGIKGDFHGKTYGTLALHKWDPDYHFAGFGPMLQHMEPIDEEQFRARRGLEKVGFYEDCAAVVLSPINGNNTLELWPEWVWEFANTIRTYGGLVIFDEVQTGFGRAGGIVSYTETDEYYMPHEGIPYKMVDGKPHSPAIPVRNRPDIWCFGKGCAAGWPMGITIARSELVDGVMTEGTHFDTMAGSPLGCYLSNRYIETLENGLLDEMLARARLWEELWKDAGFYHYGYMMAFNVHNPSLFVQIARQHGLIFMGREGKPVRFSPYHMMPARLIDEYARRLEYTLGEYHATVAHRG